MVPLLNDQLWRRSSAERVLGDARSFWLWLASIPAAYALAWWGGDVLGRLFPLLIVVAILWSFTVANLLIVTLFRRFERRADTVVQAWGPIGIAFALAWIEILASAGIKLLLASLLS